MKKNLNYYWLLGKLLFKFNSEDLRKIGLTREDLDYAQYIHHLVEIGADWTGVFEDNEFIYLSKRRELIYKMHTILNLEVTLISTLLGIDAVSIKSDIDYYRQYIDM